MKRPTDEQIDVAIEWLRINEGEEGEMESCQAVAEWLNHEMDERSLRKSAREGGIPVAALRKRLIVNAPNARTDP